MAAGLFPPLLILILVFKGLIVAVPILIVESSVRIDGDWYDPG